LPDIFNLALVPMLFHHFAHGLGRSGGYAGAGVVDYRYIHPKFSFFVFSNLRLISSHCEIA
jgi:hypothetical protein